MIKHLILQSSVSLNIHSLEAKSSTALLLILFLVSFSHLQHSLCISMPFFHKVLKALQLESLSVTKVSGFFTTCTACLVHRKLREQLNIILKSWLHSFPF